jgi:putative oxidoreductase
MEGTSQSPKLIVPPLAGFYAGVESLAWPLVRFVVGAWLMPHGAQKLFGLFGGSAAGTAQFFAKIGIEPALAMAYVVGGIEFFGGLLIAIGLLTRPAAVAAAVMLAVAAFHVHLGNGFFWPKGGFEYPMMWMFLCIAIALRGGGALSVDRTLGREF